MCRTLLLLTLSLTVAHAQESSPTPAPTYFTEAERALAEQAYRQVPERVAPRVHVLRQAGEFQVSPVGNVLVVEQRDGLVLVDSGASRGSGERVVALVRGISRKPVKAVVITHWHNDHTLGLPAVLEAWPRAEVIASTGTERHMLAGAIQGVPFAPDAGYDGKRVEQLSGYLPQFGPNLLDAKLSASEHRGWVDLVAVLPLRQRDAPGTHVVKPTRTFTDRLVLPDRDAPVEVLYLGRSNTDGDTEVWLPKQRVLATGDVVVSPIPYEFNAFPTDTLEVLGKLKAYPYKVLVPGHGRVQRDHAYLDRLAELNRTVRDAIAPLATEGVPIEEATKRHDFEALRKRFAGGDPWLRKWFDEYTLTPLIDSVYKEVKAKAAAPG